MDTTEKIKIVNMEYRDIHLEIDISVKKIQFIRMLFDHAQIHYDSEEEPEMPKAIEYLHEVLYPFLKHVDEEIPLK